LCTSEMAERHTGSNIAARIQEALEMWNVRDNHVSAVCSE